MIPYESIESHHVERDGVFLTVDFDGYVRDDVEGEVIARLIAVKIDDVIESMVIYTDNRNRNHAQLNVMIDATRGNLATVFDENP